MIINKTTLTIQDAQYLLGSSIVFISLFMEENYMLIKMLAVKCGKYQNNLF